MQTLWDNAAEEALIKRVGENIHSLMPLMQRRDSFDGTNVPRFVTNLRLKGTWSQAGSYIPSLASSPLVTPLVSPRNSTPPSMHLSRKGSFDGPFPDLFDGLGETKEGTTDTKNGLNDIRQNALATKLQRAWRSHKGNISKERKATLGETEEEPKGTLDPHAIDDLLGGSDKREEEKPSITPETDKEKPGSGREASGSSVPKDTEKEDKKREEERKVEEEKLKLLKEQAEKRRQEEEAREKAKREEEKRLREQKAEQERIEKEKERARLRKEEAKKGSESEYHPELYSRIHSELYTSYGRFDCARETNKYDKYDRGENRKWYSKLPFKDFALFVTETDCTKIDFSKFKGYSPYADNYLQNPEDLRALSGMDLTVKKYAGKDEDNPYKKVFGEGFFERYSYPFKPADSFMDIETAAQPSEIMFVHETLSGHNWRTDEDWSKGGHRLVWNQYARRFSQLCNQTQWMQIFADKVATAAKAISGTDAKWVDFTVFCPFHGELRTKFTKALLQRGIDVLDYEEGMPQELLMHKGEGYLYDYNNKYVRYLTANEPSKGELQKKQKVCETIKKKLLDSIKTAKGEYGVHEKVLYLCPVEEIIKAADDNPNLSKLFLPWQECEGLYPLEGNLAAALGTIANAKSQREWTIVLDGVADDDKRYSVSRELQESISQAIDQKATRRCCYNPIDGTISVVKKEKFPETWRKAMEACIAKDTWVDVYKHDLEVGSDFIAPAMAVEHCWKRRGYSFKFKIPDGSDELKQVAKILADYVLGKNKVHEEAREVQLTVRGDGITPEGLQNAVQKAIGAKYEAYYRHFFSFDRIVSEEDEKGDPIAYEPNAVCVSVKARRLVLGQLSQFNETITIDAFDAKDKNFCSEGFYEIEHAKDRKLSRLILPKGKELNEKEWQELTDNLWFYFFDKQFKDLIFESDEEGCKKLKGCAENNREKDPYPWRGAYRWTFESIVNGKEASGMLDDGKSKLRIVAWSEIYERQKDEFLTTVGTSNATAEVRNFTWLDDKKLAEILLKMSKSKSQGHLHVNFDTKGRLKDAVKKLLEDTSDNKRGDWILETSEDIDLASLLPYMKKYFALPYSLGNKRKILFVTDEGRCRQYASELLQGYLKDFNDKDVFEIEPYWARFCMKEVLEAAAAADSKVKKLRVNINKSNADTLRQTLLEFCKNVPVKREPFTLRLVAPSHTGEKLLENLIKPFDYSWRQSLANKSIILAGSIGEFNDKGEKVYVLGHYEVSLKFMRLEDFFIEHYINGNCYGGSKEIGESYDALPTATLFNCMNDPNCEADHFEILRDITEKEVIEGITSMLANPNGHVGWTVHFASEKIADKETVKRIADAVLQLNKDGNNRFVVPMYKDNLFLFVDKDGWERKKQMEQSKAFVYKEDLKGNRLQELLFLMSLPTSNAPTLELKDYSLNEDKLKLILDHGNRTGWSLNGCYMRCSLKGKSMCCLSINDKPYAQHFLDEETFKTEILEVFKKEDAKSLAEGTYGLGNIFDYKASYWAETYGRGFISLADALKFAEQLKDGYRTLKLKEDFDYMNRNEKEKAAKFIEWITEGLKAICKVEDPGKRLWCLSLKNLSNKQRERIKTLKLDKNAKRELVFSDGDEGKFIIGTRKPFAQRLKDGVLVLENSDLCVSNFDEIFKSANGLSGLKKVVCPTDGYESDVVQGIQKVLKFGLNKTWERITFPSGWKINEIANKINSKIRGDELPYKVEGKAEEGTGVLILKDLRLPALVTGEHNLTLRFKKDLEEEKKVQQLVFREELNTWFTDNKENRHAWEDFTEALAEQPQIQYVDFTKLRNKDVHKLYGTIEQWNRLLNIPGTIFKFVSVQPKTDNKAVVASYENLKVRNDVAWHLDDRNGKVRLFKNGSMCMKPTEDKIAVTREEGRLLWNRTALDRLFGIQGSKGTKGKKLKLLNDDEAKRVECIDFTIGDPKIEWTTSDGEKKHNWEEVWKFVGSENFLASLPKDVTIRVYAEYLKGNNEEFLSKKNKSFKTIGKQNGKQVIEIKLASLEDDGSSTADETGDEDGDHKEKKKMKRKSSMKSEDAEF